MALAHTVRPGESPKPEFIDCPRCGQPVLKSNLARQWNEWGQVCWCESSGMFDPGCHAFDEVSLSNGLKKVHHRTRT